MGTRRATLILAGLVGFFTGCASVKSTAVYYRPIKDYPAKSPETSIPILTGAVGRPYKVIGRFTFQTDRGWNFARESMIYNAQVHGADAVLLWAANSHREVSVQYAPPKVDWYPAYRHSKHGKVSTRVPYVRPGYPVRWVNEITTIDAAMIVFEK
jgi:hypothetical protein